MKLASYMDTNLEVIRLEYGRKVNPQLNATIEGGLSISNILENQANFLTTACS